MITIIMAVMVTKNFTCCQAAEFLRFKIFLKFFNKILDY